MIRVYVMLHTLTTHFSQSQSFAPAASSAQERHRAELEFRFLPDPYRRPLNRVGTLSACAVCVARRVCVCAVCERD